MDDRLVLAMFDRLSEESRKALFFARHAVSEYGGANVESEHLLFGILQAEPAAVVRFTTSDWPVHRIRERLVAVLPGGEKIPTSLEIPFGQGLGSALERAGQEADDLADPDIRPEHFVLALVSDEVSHAGRLLREAGVARETVLNFCRYSAGPG